MEKTVFSINSAGRPGNLHGKNEVIIFYPTTYKNKLKLEYRCKCKMGNHKTPRRKYMQDTFWQKMHQYFLNLSPKENKARAKNKQVWANKTIKIFTKKETINKMKRQSTEWENLVLSDMTWEIRD